MIIVEENTTATIKMYLRDFNTESFVLQVVSEDERKTAYDAAVTGTYDDFRKVLTFSYDVSNNFILLVMDFNDRADGRILSPIFDRFME